MTERGTWTLAAGLLWGAACGPAVVEERRAPPSDARRTLEAFRPPFKPVSLDAKDVAFEEAARDILRQAGLAAEVVAPAKRVRVELKDVAPLRALDSLDPRLRCVVEAGPGLDRIRFEESALPAVYVKHARIQASSEAGRLQVRLTRAPGLRPLPSHYFEVLELKDVDGASLLPEEALPAEVRHAMLRHHGFTTAALTESQRHRAPSAGRIALLKGAFVLLYPQETARPVLSTRGEGPIESEFRGWKVRLASFESRGGEVRVSLSARGDVRPLSPPLEGDDASLPVGGPGVFGTGDVELLAPDGAPIEAARTEQSIEGEAPDLTVSVTFATAREVAAIRVSCVYSHYRERIDFEFRDLTAR
jgi:hypothetical protein